MRGQSARLEHGGLIDRDRPISFWFDGRHYGGFVGDTLASALLANGVSLVGRSFKYHRPRGIATAGPEEPNALVELRAGARREPNTRATTVELFDGLLAASQNRFPSLRLDFMSAAALVAPVLRAGFYYKTFMWPASFWERVYEPLIRRAAGLGRASGLSDPDTYGESHAFCDVLVVGSGAAGLMAARAAAPTGAQVLLCEQDFVLGGRLNSERLQIEGRPAGEWVRACVQALRGFANVTILPRTAVIAAYDGRSYTAVESVADHRPEPGPGTPRQRLWKIVARQAVIATGAVERPIAFGGNDRPGVMLASAVRTYLNRFGVVPGDRTCLFTTTDEGWQTAFDLAAAGARVTAVIDARPKVADSLLTAAAGLGLRVLLNAQVSGTVGGRRLRAVRVVCGDTALRIRADVLAVSGGWNPALGLTSHLGERPRWDPGISAFVPDRLPAGLTVAGAVTGAFDLRTCLYQGAVAGVEAAHASGFGRSAWAVPPVADEATGLAPLWRSRRTRGKVFVDLQNDVTDADIELAHDEGLRYLEHLKRYTTHGMATDQGKTSGIIGQALFAELTGRPLPTLGVPISRPPVMPVAIGVLGGPHRGREFRPTRLTSGHEWATQQGAAFIETGEWLRAQWFVRPGDTDWLSSVSREVSAVRAGVGLCDVSTLGKIDVQGEDAAAFLDRVYVNVLSTLPVGKARYGLMLREDGFVMDDGTVARLADQQYFMTTTTANAGRVMQHLQFCHQVLWPDLDVQLASVSEQWAQFAIAGPRAREVLRKLVDASFDVSNAALPFLAAATLTILGGCAARLFRISFSGELAYELAVPASHGPQVLRAIAAAGEEFDLIPYGIEALSVLRIEKGHVAGNELNGRTTARDLGLGKMMSSRKDFIGAVMARRPALMDPARPALTGFIAVDGSERLRAGAHLFSPGAAISPANDEGYLTSVAFSPTLGRWIGLGLLKHGPQRHGERIRVWDPVRGGDFEAQIRSPVFVDPEGRRLHG